MNRLAEHLLTLYSFLLPFPQRQRVFEVTTIALMPTCRLLWWKILCLVFKLMFDFQTRHGCKVLSIQDISIQVNLGVILVSLPWLTKNIHPKCSSCSHAIYTSLEVNKSCKWVIRSRELTLPELGQSLRS